MGEKIRVLLLSGVVTLEHVYRETNEILRGLLEACGRFEVDIVEHAAGIGDEFLQGYDALLVNYDGKRLPTDKGTRMGATTEAAIARFVESGKGAAFYHSSAWVDEDWPDSYKNLLGGTMSTSFGSRRCPKADHTVTTVRDPEGITAHMPDGRVIEDDDLFAGIRWQPGAKLQALATIYDGLEAYRVPHFPPPHHPVDIPGGKLENMPGVNTDMPVAWTNRCGDGRVFVVTIGHCDGTIKRPGFMSLFLRGVEWAATGKATIPPPDRSGDRRLRPWPYY